MSISISSAIGYVANSPTTILLALGTSVFAGVVLLVNKIGKMELHREYDEQERDTFEAHFLENLDEEQEKIEQTYSNTIYRPFEVLAEKQEKEKEVFIQTKSSLTIKAKDNKTTALHQLRKNDKRKRRCSETQFYMEL